MLITISGSDGSGKSTLTKRLYEHTRAQGIESHLVDRWDILDHKKIPATRFVDPDLTQMRTCVEEMPLKARFRFLTWAMAISLETANQRVGENDLLLFDSYWYKHAAVEIAYGGDKQEIENLVSTMPKSDQVVFLHVPPEVTLSRIRNQLVPYECGMDKSCSDNSFITHQQKVIAQLEMWADIYGWHMIDGTRSQSDIVEEVSQLAKNSGEIS